MPLKLPRSLVARLAPDLLRQTQARNVDVKKPTESFGDETMAISMCRSCEAVQPSRGYWAASAGAQQGNRRGLPLKRILIVGLSMLAVACGSSSGSDAGTTAYCTAAESLTTAFEAKVGTCTNQSLPVSPGIPISANCASQTMGCTAADTALVTAWTTCVNSSAVSTCTPSTVDAFNNAVEECFQNIGNSFSAACDG